MSRTVTGTFEYIKAKHSLILQSDDGKSLPLLTFRFKGDKESSVYANSFKARQHSEITLYISDSGEMLLATAKPAPRDRTIRLGNWLASLLCAFAPLHDLNRRLMRFMLPSKGSQRGYNHANKLPFQRDFAETFTRLKPKAIKGTINAAWIAVGIVAVGKLFGFLL